MNVLNDLEQDSDILFKLVKKNFLKELRHYKRKLILCPPHK